MSLPDPNAAAPDSATAQLAGATDEIEKKRIELKSMLSTSFVASESHFRRKLVKICETEAHSLFENWQVSTKIGEN